MPRPHDRGSSNTRFAAASNHDQRNTSPALSGGNADRAVRPGPELKREQVLKQMHGPAPIVDGASTTAAVPSESGRKRSRGQIAGSNTARGTVPPLGGHDSGNDEQGGGDRVDDNRGVEGNAARGDEIMTNAAVAKWGSHLPPSSNKK